MSSIQDRQNSATIEQKKTSGGTVQLPGLVSQLSPVEQLSFPDTTPFRFVTTPLPGSPIESTPGVTRPLTDPSISPGVTRNLATDVQTEQLPPLRRTTTALRQPVVIRSTGKKSTGMRPPKGRRWVVQLSVTIILISLAAGALMAVAPAGTYGETGFNPFRPIINWVEGSSSNPSLLAEQAATATAVTIQPSSSQSYTGLPSAPAGTSGYDGFSYGQCTYYADFRYHQLTGNWVPWGGNAWEWAAGARAYGWHVSSSPHVPSIIVLQPGVQGASYYAGHVAVAERINKDGTVYSTSWNWYANGGGWATWSWWNFTPGPGVLFVWK